jgi:DNA-binding NarL/FixJ family response regulator
MPTRTIVEDAAASQHTTASTPAAPSESAHDQKRRESRCVESVRRTEMAAVATLTLREREVSVLVAEGMTNKQVGLRLFVSPVTVRHHLSSIFRKLRIANRFELIVFCYRHELAALPTVDSTDDPQGSIPAAG